jgi:hypothetical protein
MNQNGLVVQVGNGYERLVISDQEICDDVMATIPKLKAAASKDTFGRRWKPRKRKNGVDMFELSPSGGDDPDDDPDVAHALVAKTELRCHLNEVLNVLINQESTDYEAAMKALCGKKFQRGQVLFKQRRQMSVRSPNTNISPIEGDKESALPQEGLIGVQLATLRPRLRVKMSTKHKRTQRLVFASCTQQYPSKDRAIHVMKTIPKAAHDQVVPSDDRTALRRELDHIAVGYDIRTKSGSWGSVNQSTRIFLHAYASTVPPVQYGRVSRNDMSPALFSAAEFASRREAVMNPEATQVMEILAKSLRNIERVIRRRRFGFQTYVYFPTTYSESAVHSNCSICTKQFSFFRRDHFCQLCGHMVCNDCSQNYDVEARIGEVRKNRCCIQCVVRVDNCVFDDEELLPALGPLVVDVDDDAWLDELASEDDDTISVGSSNGSISENLFSTNPLQRSKALNQLAQLVLPSGKPQVGGPQPKTVRSSVGNQTKGPSPSVDPKQQLLRGVEAHVSQSLRETKDRYRDPESLSLYSDVRDYNYTYDKTGKQTANSNVPLAPVPEPTKEAMRLQYIKESGVLEEQYDRSALEMIAQVAAQKLGCPIGFVSVIDDTQFRAIASYNLPEIAFALPRDECLCVHSVYAEKPMIVKNPTRDMRFAQMGCIKDLGVKFYAGFPVYGPDGSVVASLCAADSETHHNISTKDYATMEVLSKLASELIVPTSAASVSAARLNARAMVAATTSGQSPSLHGREEPFIVY